MGNTQNSVVLQVFGTYAAAIFVPIVFVKVLRTVYLMKRYSELAGKVVVITGASSGLGEALAHEFYKVGCQVVLCARRAHELERVRNDLLQMHPTAPARLPVVFAFDLSDINTIPDHVNKIVSITNRIDILVNNGGISHRGSVLNTDLDVHKRIMLTNYFASVALTKAILPEMMKYKEGHIVCVSSVQGLVALPFRTAYSASKHALQAFSDGLRAEVAQDNIKVTVINPGYIRTALSLNALTERGDVHGKTDLSTEQGYDPLYVAQQIVCAVAEKRTEIVISTLLPKLAVFLRKYFPSLYFYAMNVRARRAAVS